MFKFHDDPDAPAPAAEVLAARLTMVQSFGQMMTKAYDALLHYKVNYRDGPAYKNTDLLDRAEKSRLQTAVQLSVEWMGRVERDIAAMIRRKSIKPTD